MTSLNERPTPLTDAVEFRRGAQGPASKSQELVVPADFARDLERQRDACREALFALVSHALVQDLAAQNSSVFRAYDAATQALSQTK